MLTMQINFLGTKINTLFYNDLHGATANVDAFLDEQNKYYNQKQNEPNFTLSGGDVFVGTNPNNEIIAKKLCPKTDAIALGNHDLEGGSHLIDLIKKFALKGKLLSTNLLLKRKNDLENEVIPSTIIEKNGEKIGVIGVSPLNYKDLRFETKENEFIDVQNFDKTFANVKEEVDKLTKKGINKIFILAHTGISDENFIDYYEEFAKIPGVDVIIGGHDHLQVDEWRKSDINEPVKIVSTGKTDTKVFGENLDTFGVMELEFDDDGVLIEDKSKTEFKYIEQKEEIDDTPVIVQIDAPYEKGNILYGNSEAGNIVTDSGLWYVNKYTKGKKADFAFVNAGTIRADLKETVTEKNIEQVLPFTQQKLIKTTLNKKQVLNTLNWCAKSRTFKKVTPGVMQVANMTYTINSDNTVSDVVIYDEDGSIKYLLDELDDDFEFSVVYDDFLATGVVGLTDLKKDTENDKSIEIFDTTRQKVLKEYLLSNEIKECRAKRININLI